MADLRWFAPNRYCTLPVPVLRRAGLRIALDGGESARVAVIASDIPPHRELLDGAVRFLPPHDAVALAGEIDAAISQRFREPALSPAKGLSDLTIEACAARLLPDLQRMLAGAA